MYLRECIYTLLSESLQCRFYSLERLREGEGWRGGEARTLSSYSIKRDGGVQHATVQMGRSHRGLSYGACGYDIHKPPRLRY